MANMFFNPLSFLRGQIEDKDGEVENAHTGNDKVYDVEEWFSPNLQVEENV
jgi:hypothetical protein